MKVIPYGRQNITDEDIAAVVAALKSDFLTQGPAIREFEEAFAKAIGARYAVAVANGTAALHLGAVALNVSEHSRVLTTPITFAASANAVLYCGGSIEFIDIDPITRCIDLDLLESCVREKPRGYYQGVIPVSLAGYPVDLVRLRAISDEHDLWIMEDACHAPGAFQQYEDGARVYAGASTHSELACFSFHPVKHITTGEGGVVTTNSEKLFRKLERLRTHGITRDPSELPPDCGGWYYEMADLGFNYRLTDIQAALGISQLSRLAMVNERRNVIADRYDRELQDLPISLPTRPPRGGLHAFHLYIIETEDRRALYDFLKARSILPQVHYIPINQMPFYRKLGYRPEQTPRAQRYYERALSLPMYPSLTDEEQSFVIETLRSFYRSRSTKA